MRERRAEKVGEMDGGGKEILFELRGSFLVQLSSFISQSKLISFKLLIFSSCAKDELGRPSSASNLSIIGGN